MKIENQNAIKDAHFFSVMGTGGSAANYKTKVTGRDPTGALVHFMELNYNFSNMRAQSTVVVHAWLPRQKKNVQAFLAAASKQSPKGTHLTAWHLRILLFPPITYLCYLQQQ